MYLPWGHEALLQKPSRYNVSPRKEACPSRLIGRSGLYWAALRLWSSRHIHERNQVERLWDDQAIRPRASRVSKNEKLPWILFRPVYHFSSLFTRVYMQCLPKATQRCQKQGPSPTSQRIDWFVALSHHSLALSLPSERRPHQVKSESRRGRNPFSAASNLVWIPDIERHQWISTSVTCPNLPLTFRHGIMRFHIVTKMLTPWSKLVAMEALIGRTWPWWRVSSGPAPSSWGPRRWTPRSRAETWPRRGSARSCPSDHASAWGTE